MLSDDQLIDELKKRFLENKKLLDEQTKLSKKLRFVNKKLEESESLKSHFLSNIKNEINNPLASILGLAMSIHRPNVEPEKVMHTSSLIFAEAFSLDFQLKNIFAAAEIEAGEFLLGHMKVDIETLVEGVVSSFNHVLKKKNIDLKIRSKIEEGRTFTTDSEKLQIVLSNIINNAIEYSKDDSQIEVVSSIENNILSVSISDQGVGIPLEKQREIYDRFKQLDAGTTKSHHGHGLGLSITTAVMQLLAGNLSLESTEGKGSTFTVVIPQGDVNDNDDFSSDGNEFLFNADETF